MAGTEVGSLYYDLGIDDKNLKSGLDSADKSVKGFGSSVGKFGDTVQAGFRDVSKVLAVAAVGLTAFAKNATDFTENFVKSSKGLGVQIGVSTTEASRLVAAFGRMGIEADAASQMFGIFSKQIVHSTEASKDNLLATQKLTIEIDQTKLAIKQTTDEITKHGDKTGDLTLKLRTLQNTLQQQQSDLAKSADSFQKLGISTIDASGKQKDFNTILLEVADKFKAMPNGVEKTTIALDLFGRSGKDMIKVLNLGAGGIQDLEKQADKLGLTLNEKTIGAVAGLVKSQKDLKEQTDALKIAVGTATAPVLTRFNEEIVKLTQHLVNSGEPMKSLTTNVLAFGGPVATAGASVTAFLGNVSSIGPKTAAIALRLGAVGLVVGALAGGIYELQVHFHIFNDLLPNIEKGLQGVWYWFNSLAIVAAFMSNPMGYVNNALDKLNTITIILGQYWTQVLWPAIQAVAMAIWQNLGPALGQLWEAVVRLWNALQPALMEALKIIAIILAGLLLAAIWAVVSVLNILIQVFAWVVSAISNVINWIANLIGWFGNLVGFVWNAINTVIAIIRNLPAAARDVIGLVGSIFGLVPGLIKGAFGNAYNLLYDFGKWILWGLKDGILSVIGSITAVAGNIGDAIKNKVKGILGIHSPSKVFHEIGQNVTAGFVRGVESSIHLAANAMGSFSDAVVSPTMNINPAAASGGGVATTHNYGSTTVNIGTVEDRQDADYILNRVNQNQRLQSRGVAPI